MNLRIKVIQGRYHLQQSKFLRYETILTFNNLEDAQEMKDEYEAKKAHKRAISDCKFREVEIG